MSDGAPILVVRDLHKSFARPGRWRTPGEGKKAVDGFSLTLSPGETLGIVGESGCGKSTVARLILRLIEPDAGSIEFDGVDLRALPREDLRRMRPRMQLVFQDPYSSLDPRMTVGAIIEEGLIAHGIGDAPERSTRVRDALERVGLRAEFADRYPHEFSGGQRQRVGIARALILEPALVIADEPVSALDVSVQAQVLNLLADLQKQRGLSMIFVAHDIAVVEQVSERIAVMFAGRVVESGRTEDLIARPLHPYTQALLAAVLSLDPEARGERLSCERTDTGNTRLGCAYYARCPSRQARCAEQSPPESLVGDDRTVACHLAA